MGFPVMLSNQGLKLANEVKSFQSELGTTIATMGLGYSE
jgi:hypothetical protein